MPEDRKAAAKELADAVLEIGKYIHDRQITLQLLDRRTDELKRKCTGFFPYYLENLDVKREKIEASVAEIRELIELRTAKRDSHERFFREAGERLVRSAEALLKLL